MRSSVGPAIVVAGILLVVVGLLAWSGWLSWFGRLPGDIRSPRGGFFFPVTSSILISIVLTVLVNVLIRIFRDRG